MSFSLSIRLRFRELFRIESQSFIDAHLFVFIHASFPSLFLFHQLHYSPVPPFFPATCGLFIHCDKSTVERRSEVAKIRSLGRGKGIAKRQYNKHISDFQTRKGERNLRSHKTRKSKLVYSYFKMPSRKIRRRRRRQQLSQVEKTERFEEIK